jgi:ribA/ribD-fused uncharacterized protein
VADIISFTGEWEFLSNYAPSPIVYQGRLYATVEHAYQAAKVRDPVTHELVRAAETPDVAKALGRAHIDRIDWEDAKLDVMYELVALKFQRPDQRGLLLTTGTASLVEGNTWGDTYWGRHAGVGRNHLGEILMRIRAELTSDDPTC